jgi:hypothetical protein
VDRCDLAHLPTTEGSFDEIGRRRLQRRVESAAFRPRFRSAGSERDLSAHDDGVELAAHRGAGGRPGNAASRRGREALVDLAVRVVEQEAHIGVRIPVQPDGVDRLLAAADGIAPGRGPGDEIVVQIDGALARGQFERAAAATVKWQERMFRHRPQIRACRRRIFALFSGQDPAAFDVAALETIRRKPLPVDIDQVGLAIDQKIAPLDDPSAAVYLCVLERNWPPCRGRLRCSISGSGRPAVPAGRPK